MTIGELKAKIANLPDDMYISVVDLDKFDMDFEISDIPGETYTELILPCYINDYTVEE